MTRFVIRCVCGAVGLLAGSTATALAGNGYAGNGVAGQSTGGGGGVLPFTGADLAVYVVVGVALFGTGLALRGFTARRPH